MTYGYYTDAKITTLDSLSQHGINMADIERVKSAGINTIKGPGSGKVLTIHNGP